MKKLLLKFFIATTFFSSCETFREKENYIAPAPFIDTLKTVEDSVKNLTIAKEDTLELRLSHLGLVDVKSMDTSLVVDIRYSTENNFTSKKLYTDLDKCYLQMDVAKKLCEAQRLLKEKFPYYSLLIFDGARPSYVQKQMWEELKGIGVRNRNFLSDPAKGSLHNYGAAVDLSLINEKGMELDMGTPYDDMSELAYPSNEPKFLQSGELTTRQYQNRLILRNVMVQAGFMPIESEWWHFNACSRNTASAKYQLIN